MDAEIWPLGDTALLLRFGGGVDAAANAQVHAAAAAIRAAALPGVAAVAPAYASLLVALDLPLLARHGGPAQLRLWVQSLLAGLPGDAPVCARIVEVPTRYGGADGPDLDTVAAVTGLRAEEVVERHASTRFRVAMLGFRPGFPYLLGLPAELHLPRRASVRPRVAAGSVAIAGAQAGIYPSESPGGWHLIGRTALELFDPQRTPPSLLLPGDEVRFVPVRA